MPRPFATFLASLLLAASAALAAAPLRMGGFVVAPLVMGVPEKPLRGALRDYLEQEVAPAGVALQWMPPMSLPGAMRALRDGLLDVVLVGSGEAAREPGTVPSSWNYLRSQPQLAVRTDSPLRDVRALDQLAGLQIGWIAGPQLSPGLLKSGARWQRIDAADWQVRTLRLVQSGDIDAAYFENDYSPRYYARAMGMPIRLVRLPMPPRSFFMLYSAKADRAQIDRFDRVAGEAFAGRRFRDFLDRYPAEPMPQ
jgi:polar amino acid transport system substrate-binding protein